MCKLYLTSKEVATKLGVKSRLIDNIFRKSKIPTIHRDTNGSKTLIENGNFILLLEILHVIVNSIKETKYSKKKLNILRLHFLHMLLSQYKDQDATQFTLLADVNDIFNVIVTFDYGFDRFIVHDFLSDTEYRFGKSWNISTDINNKPKGKNKEHPVGGFWKNQPYGPAGNKFYKRIWIESFIRGGRN